MGLVWVVEEHLSGAIINELIEAACHLSSRSDQKEIVVASLNLLKVLCSIFQSAVLAQYLDKICDCIHSLHVKRPSSAASTTNTNTDEKKTTSPAVAVAAINKSSRIKTLVKMVLKKLLKKFTYEIVVEKVFANESSSQGSSRMEVGEKPALTGVVRHGLENLLVNLRKLIEKDRLRKAEELGGKKSSADAADLVSVYTANYKNNPKSVVLNE